MNEVKAPTPDEKIYPYLAYSISATKSYKTYLVGFPHLE